MMSLASRAVAILNDKYRKVLNNMRVNRWSEQVRPLMTLAKKIPHAAIARSRDAARRITSGLASGRRRGGGSEFCRVDTLEPRLFMTTTTVSTKLVMVVNDADRNNNNVIDMAEGYTGGPSSAANALMNFTKIELAVPTNTGTTQQVVISYDASAPNGVSGNTIDGFVPAAGSGGANTGMLRLWYVNGDSARNGSSKLSGGDYIAPGTYTYAQLSTAIPTFTTHGTNSSKPKTPGAPRLQPTNTTAASR